MKNLITINSKTRVLEIIAVLTTGLGKFLFMDCLDLKLPFILFACFAWLSYVVFRYKKDQRILDYWGFNLTNFKNTFTELTPFLVFIIVAFIGVGYWFDLSVLNVSIIPILVIYPIWGIIQQFIIIALLAKNLKEHESVNVSDTLIIWITSIVFAVVHYPYFYLMIGTFFLAMAYTYLYLNKRNLIVLGIFHGWLGGFFYYCILGRDTFEEVFKLLK